MKKFQTFDRGKILIFSALFLILMSLVFNACRNELDFGQPYSTETGGLSKQITEVKEWFETNYHFEPSKITDVKRFGKIEPIWNRAILENGVLEVPIMMNNQITLPSLYEGLVYKGKQRLMISEKGGTKSMFIINIMPSKDFKGQMKDVTALNYRKKSFDGLISAFSLNGESMGGYLFEQGTLTKKLKEINKNDSSFKNGLSTRGACKCYISVYDCFCGTVNGGEPQCSICIEVSCYGDCSNTDPDPDPPGDCEGDPLCITNPDPDPNYDPDPCPNKTGLFATDKVGTYSNLPWGTITFNSRITQVDLKGGSYVLAPIETEIEHILPSAYSFTSNTAQYVNDFDELSCTRTIVIGYYGNFTHTFLEEIVTPAGSAKIQSTVTRDWGHYEKTWTFN